MLRVLALAVLLTFTAGACIKITSPEVSVTAEPQPEALQGSRWQDLPVQYCIVESNRGFASISEFRRLTAQAFKTWGIAAVDRGTCSDGIERSDGVNEIGWGDVQEAQGGAQEAGYTRTVYRECRGGCANGARNRIVEADITISDDPPARWQTSDCLYATLLHETGHFLGLPHLDSPAIMAPSSATCPQQLTPADRSAFDSLYPGN